MRQYEMCELTFYGETDSEAWALAAPEAELICGEFTHKVKGFVAGEGIYKVRFLPEIAGIWKYRVTGVVCAEGTVEVEPAREGAHGKLSAVECHFESQDDTVFTPFGTTVYALVHQTEELFEETMHTLSKAPFNKIRFCIFPKHYDFNHNEPRYYAFEKDADGKWDVNRPCFSFWDMLDDAILRLQKMEIECDLILFHPYDRWGFSTLSEDEDFIYLDYLLRRLSAMPNVWWSMANEYDLVDSKTNEHWQRIEEFICENDLYHHLLGNHNCLAFWDHTRKNITHASLQTKSLSRVPEWRTKYKKPICIDECCYEGNVIHQWGSISGREMTYRFWRVVTNGGYCTHGETFYSEDEILWWSRGGRLKGESPKRIAFLRDIVNELPGPIEPMPNIREKILSATQEELESVIEQGGKEAEFFHKKLADMGTEELRLFMASEPSFAGHAGHAGEDAYLIFYDIRTCIKAEIQLPKDKMYKLELIDVWNMTRETIQEGVYGTVQFNMPGKEGYAVLATREGK